MNKLPGRYFEDKPTRACLREFEALVNAQKELNLSRQQMVWLQAFFFLNSNIWKTLRPKPGSL